MKKKKKNKIQTISGSEYIIIRDDFTKYNHKVKIRKNIKLIHRFLINQNYNKKLLIYILQTINTLNSTKLVNIKLQIFSMKKNLKLKKLIKSLKLNFKIELRFEITNLQKYIVRSDLGIDLQVYQCMKSRIWITNNQERLQVQKSRIEFK